MKISAQELVLLNRRNLKNEGTTTSTTSPVETPTVSPEATMNALHAQGMNNISFQSAKAAVVKKAAQTLALAGGLFAASMATQSCAIRDDLEAIKDMYQRDSAGVVVNVNNSYNVSVVVNNDIEPLIALLMQMMEQNKEADTATQEQLKAMLEELINIKSQLQENQIALVEAQTKIYEIQLKILEQLIQSNKNDETMQDQLANIEKSLAEIKLAVENGDMTIADGIKAVEELLGQINGKMDNVIEVLKNIQADFQKFYAQYEQDKEKAFEYLGGIYENGKLNNDLLVKYGDYVVAMNHSVKMIKENTDKLINNIQNNHEEVIDVMKNLSAEERKLMEEMFNFYGLKFEDLINMTSEKIVELLRNFSETYEKTEGKQVELMLEINDKLNFVANWPGLDNSGIEDALKDLTDAVNNGSAGVAGKLENIDDRLAEMQKTLNRLASTVSSGFANVEKYNAEFAKDWDKLMAWMENFDGDLSVLEAGQKDIKFFLNEQLKELNAIKEAIKELDIAAGGNGNGSSNLEIEDLRKMLEELGDKYLAAFEQIIVDNKLDLGYIEDLLETIEGKIGALKQPIDYSKDLAELKDLLAKLQAQPDYSEKLDEIIKLIKEFKCNCDCGGSNEGILGDLNDLLG